MVDNNRRTKHFFRIIFEQLGVTICVLVVALFSIGYAAGYRIDFGHLRIYKTGAIKIEFLPSDSTVLVNNKIAKVGNPPYIDNLLPGNYHFEVSKNGFNSWQKDLYVASESVNIYKYIVLFRSNPDIKTITDKNTIDSINFTQNALADNSTSGLYYSGYEIWIGSNLVARFSKPIYSAVYYTDQNHIVYQQGDEIRVMELNAEDDQLLVKLSSSASTNYTLNGDGSVLYFIDGTSFKSAEIR